MTTITCLPLYNHLYLPRKKVLEPKIIFWISSRSFVFAAITFKQFLNILYRTLPPSTAFVRLRFIHLTTSLPFVQTFRLRFSSPKQRYLDMRLPTLHSAKSPKIVTANPTSIKLNLGDLIIFNIFSLYNHQI